MPAHSASPLRRAVADLMRLHREDQKKILSALDADERMQVGLLLDELHGVSMTSLTPRDKQTNPAAGDILQLAQVVSALSDDLAARVIGATDVKIQQKLMNLIAEDRRARLLDKMSASLSRGTTEALLAIATQLTPQQDTALIGRYPSLMSRLVMRLTGKTVAI
jgi:Mg/Co/Ni transporter MgtE